MPYTEIEESIIKPSDRYAPISGYPQDMILCHHQAYLDLIPTIADNNIGLHFEPHFQGKNYKTLVEYRGRKIIVDDSKDNAEESVTHLIREGCYGVKSLINIGSAGAISRELRVGDHVVGLKAIRDNRSVWNLASEDVIAKSDEKLSTALINMHSNSVANTSGVVWTNGNMYYGHHRLDELRAQNQEVLCVETEMEALCIAAGWLNYNYSQTIFSDPLRVGNLFYMSDILPERGSRWVDTMNDMSLLVPYKLSVLQQAIDALTL